MLVRTNNSTTAFVYAEASIAANRSKKDRWPCVFRRAATPNDWWVIAPRSTTARSPWTISSVVINVGLLRPLCVGAEIDDGLRRRLRNHRPQERLARCLVARVARL